MGVRKPYMWCKCNSSGMGFEVGLVHQCASYKETSIYEWNKHCLWIRSPANRIANTNYLIYAIRRRDSPKNMNKYETAIVKQYGERCKGWASEWFTYGLCCCSASSSQSWTSFKITPRYKILYSLLYSFKGKPSPPTNPGRVCGTSTPKCTYKIFDCYSVELSNKVVKKEISVVWSIIGGVFGSIEDPQQTNNLLLQRCCEKTTTRK